uniref:Uncharacterized protein n=1 Tax=Amphimedon queenslandica TaxID=400682 RepID=A0A1X7UA89_AMPQE
MGQSCILAETKLKLKKLTIHDMIPLVTRVGHNTLPKPYDFYKRLTEYYEYFFWAACCLCGKFIIMLLLLCILLHSVLSLNIRIDGDNGNDSIECLQKQPQSSCQSLKYVADTINNTGNLTIEIISPTLSLQGSVIFTDINGLTINGQGTSISCSNGSMFYVNFSNNNGYGLVLNDSSGHILQNIFSNNGIKNMDYLDIKESNTRGGGGLHIIQHNVSTNGIAIISCHFIGNTAGTAGGAIGFILHGINCYYYGAIPIGFHITLLNCNITNNRAEFGGGVGIQIFHDIVWDNAKGKLIRFESCYFSGNKAIHCHFIGNVAKIENYQQQLR